MNPSAVAALPPCDIAFTFARPVPDAPLLAAAVARLLSPQARFDVAAEALELIADHGEGGPRVESLYALHRALRREQVAGAARAFGLYLAAQGAGPIPPGLLEEGWDADNREAGLEEFLAAGPIGLAASPGGRCIACALEPLAPSSDPNTVPEHAVAGLALGMLMDLYQRSSAPDAGSCGSDYDARPAPNGLWELSCRVPGASRLLIVAPHAAFNGA